FFQAEDGIRDGHVTGVQTCALPIFKGREERRPVIGEEAIERDDQSLAWHSGVPGVEAKMLAGLNQQRVRRNSRAIRQVREVAARSEERRVGKGCRWRRAPEP